MDTVELRDIPAVTADIATLGHVAALKAALQPSKASAAQFKTYTNKDLKSLRIEHYDYTKGVDQLHRQNEEKDVNLIRYRSFNEIISRKIVISTQLPHPVSDFEYKGFASPAPNVYQFLTRQVSLLLPQNSTLFSVRNHKMFKLKEKVLFTFNLKDHPEELSVLRQELVLLQSANAKSNYTIQTEPPLVELTLDINAGSVDVVINYKVFYGPYVNQLIPLNVAFKISNYLNSTVEPNPLPSEHEELTQDPSTPVSAHIFYDAMSEHAKLLPDSNKNFELPELETNLMRFQRRTVNWMLGKESVEYDWDISRCKNKNLISKELHQQLLDLVQTLASGSEINTDAIDRDIYVIINTLCFGWVRVWFKDMLFWYNKYTSNFIDQISMYRFIINYYNDKTCPEMLPAQGLLAEEMGLGKTVEVTGLTLLNPRPIEQIDEIINIQLTAYGDPKPILQTKTTLIIAPDSILKQWIEEILRLAPSLAVTIYKGLNKYPKLNNNPRLIADYLKMFDIVFTTYSTISKELDYALYSSRNNNTRASSRKRSSPLYDNDEDAEDSDNSNADSFLEKAKQEENVYDQDALLKDYRSLFQLSMLTKKPKIANMKTDESQDKTDYERILEDEIILATRHNKLPDIYRNASYESPLMLLQFWRVVLDEVQMVSSKISRPFQCASLIPRFHSWAVSGTPIKKNLNDLHSVLEFLKYKPFCGKIGKASWEKLTNISINTNTDFVQLWRSIGLRHTKAMVHDDIKLPPQNRVLMTIPFNVVEQENYNQVLEECLASICLDINGTPVIDSWEPTPSIVSYMKSWLVRLRQICCNPQVGQLNLNTRRYKTRYYMYHNTGHRFVQTVQVLKTLENVLEDMLDSASSEIVKTERTLINSFTDLGLLCEITLYPKYARTVFEFVSMSTQAIIARTKHQLSQTKRKRNSLRKVVEDINSDDEYGEEDLKETSDQLNLTDQEARNYEKLNESIKLYNSRLRLWYIILHKCYFLLASSYFQDYDPEYLQKIKDKRNPLYESYMNNTVLNTKEAYNYQDISKLLTGDFIAAKLITENTLLQSFVEPEVSEDPIDVQKLKHLEQQYYNLAEQTRQMLLRGTTENVHKAVDSRILNREYFTKVELEFIDDGTLLVPKTTKKFFKQLPFISINEFASEVIGIKVTLYFNRIQKMADLLNAQAQVINEWMTSLIKILCSPLLTLDQDPNGLEYEKTIEDQEKASCYLHLLTKMLTDRSSAIEGKESSTRIVSNSKQKEQRDFDMEMERVNDKEFLNQLEEKRQEVKPMNKPSFNDLIREIKDLEHSISDEKSIGSSDANLQLDLLDKAARRVRQIFDNQKLSNVLLQRELSTNCNFVFNARIDYFKQLQQISDSVKMPDYFQTNPDQTHNPAIEYGFRRAIESLKAVPLSMGKLVTKFKYLQSLNNTEPSTDTSDDNLMCIICRTTITIGSLTPCGHKYCKDCLEQWLSNHRSCPMCKSTITTSSIYNFTHYVPDLKANKVQNTKSSKKNKEINSIYKHVDDLVVGDIQKIKLKNSYSSKVDMIVKQVLYLKQKDPGVQIVVFSQWQDLLYILATAFKDAGITYLASYGTLTAEVGAGRPRSKYDSVEKFKDPSNQITCFLLNAKAQASGLNLINATHIFLCEPLVNTSLELQAISRIHRIGQTKVTTVWMFAIENTVEESIVLLSTKKRLDFIREHDTRDDAAGMISQARDLSQAESLTLMKSGGIDTLVNRGQGEGETVSNSDLWDAFFCATSSNEMSNTMNVDTMSKIQ